MMETFENIHVAFEAAAQARANGDDDRAVEIYRGIASQFPEKKHGVAAAVSSLRSMGRYNDAIVVAERALQTLQNSHGLWMELTNCYMALGLPDRAVEYIQRHLDRNPSHPQAWTLLGKCLFEGEHEIDAEHAFGKAIALNPLDAEALMGLGDVMFKVGRKTEGLSCYQRARLSEPDNPAALFKLGSALIQSQRLEEAEALLRKAIMLDPNNGAAQVNLATVLHHAGRNEEAEPVARAALAVAPTLAIAHLTLGEVLLELGRFQEAAPVLRRAEELRPRWVLALTPLAVAEAALGNTAEAERILDYVIVIEPGNLEARHLKDAVTGRQVRTVPDGYAAQVFNWLASRFDDSLVGALKYRGAEETLALLREIAPERDAFTSFLDLGCGTGVIGATVGEIYRMDREVGVDVAAKMLAVAEAKGVYDELVQSDAADYLAANRDAFDLISAIDVFPHVGDVSGLMPLIAAALKAGGLFVYTIENLSEAKPSEGMKLMPTGRFAHTQAFIDGLARDAGLAPVAAKPIALRLDRGAPVAAIIGAFRR